MAIGISTSCFYPLETEKAFELIGRNAGGTAEIFLNAASELSAPFAEKLERIRQGYGMCVNALHTYASFSESFFLFSAYERRFRDGVEGFKRYFDFARRLGANMLILHGWKEPRRISEQEYFERFGTLCRLGREAGLLPVQENVARYISESPDFLCRMRDALGGDFKMALDVKQARRAGYTPEDFVGRLADSIAHIHISDYTSLSDCVTPLKGDFNFAGFFRMMREKDYRGDYIIELYRDSYAEAGEIFEARRELEKLAADASGAPPAGAEMNS